MKSIKVTLPAKKAKTYPITIDFAIAKNVVAWLPKTAKHIVIITDRTVKKLYAASLVRRLKQQGCRVLLIAITAGETAKNANTKQSIEETMLQHHCDRATLVIALGGGVVGDMAGFVAATYMRGIAVLQMPTTLLAMVDSSVGGKTGINMPQGKNLIGAFWQPIQVIADIHYLHSLPQKQLRAGLIEAIKMFLTSDKKKFYRTTKNLTAILACEKPALIALIQSAVTIKARVVQQDETENHARMILNFGHTIGHALEKACHYKILHGIAVGYGILLEAKIAELLGWLSAKHFFVIQQLLAKLHIHGRDFNQWDIEQLIQFTKIDKKVRHEKVHYVLLKNIGAVHQSQGKTAHPVSDHLVKKAFSAIIEATL